MKAQLLFDKIKQGDIMIKVLVFVLFLLFCMPTQYGVVNAEELYTPSYYRIESSNCLLYRTAQDNQDISNVWFLLPKTYFVQVLDESDELFFKVKYQDFIGYVFKTDVSAVYETPQFPWADNLTFDINGTANVVIRSAPSSDSAYLGLIPFNATSVTYHGSIVGDEALSGLGNSWYFATYTSFEQGIISGYVYAPLTQNLTVIQDNTEVLSTVKPSSGNEIIDEVISPELQNGQNLLIIGLLSLVGIAILFLLFRPKRKAKKAKQSVKGTQLNQSNNNKQFLTFDESDNF